MPRWSPRPSAHNPDYPLFIGVTTLNTRDTVERMRYVRDLGVTGVLLGRPMWTEMTPATMIRFYRDVAEAVPDLAICVYDNTAAFRGVIPTEVYAALAEIPQVVAVKYAGGAAIGFRYHNDLRAVQGRATNGDRRRGRFDPYPVDGCFVVGCKHRAGRWRGSSHCDARVLGDVRFFAG
ncbi:MAG: dihydrodipicolinate synthase family protein [Sphaerobacter sp.]|nr:dihydrodipicolinate synthase family protein [Sphaerobacter sp.]